MRKGAWLLLCAAMVASAFAQEKVENAEVPRIVMAAPLAVSPGAIQTLKLRGLKLDQATAVRVTGTEGLSDLPIKKRDKAGLPPQVEAKEAGDTELEVELAVPAEFAEVELMLVVESPGGKSQPYSLRVIAAAELADENEPNDGFAKPQAAEPGKFIRGAIQQQRDVDVFRFVGRAGQMLVAEVWASRRGSTLDGWLGLYDDRGQIVASNDDWQDAGRDPLLKAALPADGDYHLVLLDANDRGGATHPYLLQVRFE